MLVAQMPDIPPWPLQQKAAAAHECRAADARLSTNCDSPFEAEPPAFSDHGFGRPLTNPNSFDVDASRQITAGQDLIERDAGQHKTSTEGANPCAFLPPEIAHALSALTRGQDAAPPPLPDVSEQVKVAEQVKLTQEAKLCDSLKNIEAPLKPTLDFPDLLHEDLPHSGSEKQSAWMKQPVYEMLLPKQLGPAGCGVVEGGMLGRRQTPNGFPVASAAPCPMQTAEERSYPSTPLHPGRTPAGSCCSQAAPDPSMLDGQRVPLREMQRLLHETWRYQQGGESLSPWPSTGSDPQHSPVRFSCGEDGPVSPPPCCTDFVEVCGPQGVHRTLLDPVTAGSSVNTDVAGRGPLPAQPGYVYLGRLVATLPGEEMCQLGSDASRSPQAVVECNFWQLQNAGATSSDGSTPASTRVHAGPSAVSSRGNPGVHNDANWCMPSPASRGMAGVALAAPRPPSHGWQHVLPHGCTTMHDHWQDDQEDLPPWPHEM